ncbi:hypothetical protein V8G54_012761 [Vigna mungo]|uniref:Cytochrome b5 heme-binding domain-containing protein n=1 Tax=Vigna mungo TaxID=3915 RepID=A0AAQ3NRR2_VIGMU
MGMYTSVMEEITFYTGLSPAAFFTVLAMMVVVYRTVSAMFVSPEDYNKPPVVSARTHPQFEDPEPPRQPVQLGQVTDRELRAYDGSDPNKPLLMAIRGQIFDVSTGRIVGAVGGCMAGDVELKDIDFKLALGPEGSYTNRPLYECYNRLDGPYARVRANFYGPGGPYAMFAGKECSRALALLSFKPEDINGDLEGLGESEFTILEDWEFKFIEKYPKVGLLIPEQREPKKEEQVQDSLENSNEYKDETK